jgi:hypothetical protein
MLLDPQPLEVVQAAPPLVLEDPIEGLDGRDELPPLLCPDVLCDLEGYAAWERASIAVLGRPHLTSQQALDWIEAATERVRSWRPGRVPLSSHVAAAFDDRTEKNASLSLPDEELLELVWRLTEGRVPPDSLTSDCSKAHAGGLTEDALAPYDRAMKNFLAARLFGNWIAYQGRGLRSIVQWVRAAAALVRHHAIGRALDTGRPLSQNDFIEAVRTTDLVLLHAIDTQAFARAIAPREGRFTAARDRLT